MMPQGETRQSPLAPAFRLPAQSLLSFLVVWFVTVITILVFCLPVVQSVLNFTFLRWFGLVFGVSLVASTVQFLFMTYVLTYRDTIVYRRLYDVLDLWFTTLGIFAGLLAAILRIASVLPLLVATFTRSDLVTLPHEYAAFLDFSHGAFRSFFLQHAQFGNPLRICATLILRQGAEEFARRRAAARGDRYCVDARPLIHTSALYLQGWASALGRLSGKPAVVASEASQRGDPRFPRAPANATASPSAVAPSQHYPDTALRMLMRRQRARNRWHLALTLAMHPHLRFSRNHEVGPETIGLTSASAGHWQREGAAAASTLSSPVESPGKAGPREDGSP